MVFSDIIYRHDNRLCGKTDNVVIDSLIILFLSINKWLALQTLYPTNNINCADKRKKKNAPWESVPKPNQSFILIHIIHT